MPKSKKKSDGRSKTVTIRVTENEFDDIKRKSGEAGVSISEFARNASLGKQIHHIHEGKKIVEQLGLLHGKMQIYHRDIANCIQQLQNAVQENVDLLLCKSKDNEMPDLCETFQLQNKRINIIINTIMDAYAQNEKKTQEAAHSLIEEIPKEG